MSAVSKPGPRYKALLRLEEEAQRQLEELLAGYTPLFAALPEPLRRDMVERLRPQAQRAILRALEGRIENTEEHFGFDWEDALVETEASPAREEAAQYLLAQLPTLNQALDEPAVIRRDHVEWLYAQTVDRIRTFTPYLTNEEKELDRWNERCPDAFASADPIARKAAQGFQDRSRPDKNAPAALTDEARDLAYLANMIAARKLYLLATGANEFYETHKTSIALKVPPALQGAFGAKAYVRMGIGAKPVSYRSPTERQLGNYQAMIESQMLPNLQEKICPWTTEQATARKIDSNLLAKAYYRIIKPVADRPAGNHRHEMTFRHLGQRMDQYRLLGFSEDIAPEHARLFEEFLDASSSLQHFLEKPSVREAFKIHRADKSLVELCLSAAVADEFVRVAQKWRPEAESNQPEMELLGQAQNALPHIIQDLGAYHDALMRSDYISVRGGNHFKERLMREHLASVTPTERARIESHYKPVAITLVAKDEGSTEPIPAGWKADRTYRDPVTRAEFTDYTIDMGQEHAIVCLRKGASPRTAEAAIAKLIDLNQPALINDPAARIKGVRVSELSYNELRASCLRPNTIARMQFYTSFSADETLNILRGTSEEPTVENIIEALKPCFILRYRDTYCRVKPAEIVRVKYRTPTGEKKNPCWDASQVVGGMKPKDARMRARFDDPRWGLIIIEGEKKAALLAQMVLERQLPYHVLALPGVWMGLVRGKLVEELEQFRMKDAAGNRRNCFIFFDNDKAFKAGVTHAMIDTARALQRAGANVFVPNLPFGKEIKGADDFAVAHCRRGNDIDYQPLVDIVENATHIPEKPRKVKYPSPEEERNIRRYLEEAERVHELQNRLTGCADPANAPELRKLFLLQAAHQMQIKTEREAGAHFDSLDEEGRGSVLAIVMRDNPALKQLKRACGQIPSFEGGPTPKAFTNGFAAERDRLILTPDLFTVG